MEEPRPWHPFRRPGFCGLRGTLYVLFAVAWLVVLPLLLRCPDQRLPQHLFHPNLSYTFFPDTTATPHTRFRRWISTDELLTSAREPDHPYATNLWWRYANQTARLNGHRDCYVCSCMPYSSSHPSIEASPLTHRTSMCLHDGYRHGRPFRI